MTVFSRLFISALNAWQFNLSYKNVGRGLRKGDYSCIPNDFQRCMSCVFHSEVFLDFKVDKKGGGKKTFQVNSVKVLTIL